MTCIRFVVPVKAPSLTNQREHHAVRHKRTDAQRSATRRRWPGYEGGPLLVVRLTRTAPRRLDDDNVQAALKSVRDEVAALLRVDDASPLVRWEYGQEQGPEDAVRVEVSWGSAPEAVLGRLLHTLAAQAEHVLRAEAGRVVDVLPSDAAQAALPLPALAPAAPDARAGPPRPLEAIPETPRRPPRKSPADLRSLATPNHRPAPGKEKP